MFTVNFIFIMMLIFFSHINEIARVNSCNHVFIYHYKQLMMYFALVKSKSEYASVSIEAITITNSRKFECIQRKFAGFFYNRFFQNIWYHCDILL